MYNSQYEGERMNKVNKKKVVSTVALTVLLGSSMGTSASPSDKVFYLDQTEIGRVYAAEVTEFKDVANNYFAREAISSLAGKQIIMGFPNNLFKPEETVTRGQFAAMIARALELPKADVSFKDLSKNMALYDGISRAAKAGILKGDTKGYVNSSQPITRADVAVMVDRALQLKGKYKQTGSLTFKDANSLPSYASDSIKRMTFYGIIQGKGNNTFAPSEAANRATSAVFIYRMLNLLEEKPSDGGTVPTNPTNPPVTNPSPPPTDGGVTDPAEKDYHDMTLAEIKALVGEYTLLERIVLGGKEQIRTIDYVENYYKQLQDPDFSETTPSPEKYFDGWVESNRGGFASMTASHYPKEREIIAWNGVAYKDSDLFFQASFEKFMPDIYRVLPSQPKEEGKFLIDVMSFSPNFVTYTNKSTTPHSLEATPVESGNGYIVNLKNVFQKAPGVKVANGGAEISYGGNKVVLTSGKNSMVVNGISVPLSGTTQLKDGAYYANIRDVAKGLGLDTRKVVQGVMFNYRLEIANYPLEKEEGVWE